VTIGHNRDGWFLSDERKYVYVTPQPEEPFDDLPIVNGCTIKDLYLALCRYHNDDRKPDLKTAKEFYDELVETLCYYEESLFYGNKTWWIQDADGECGVFRPSQKEPVTHYYIPELPDDAVPLKEVFSE